MPTCSAAGRRWGRDEAAVNLITLGTGDLARARVSTTLSVGAPKPAPATTSSSSRPARWSSHSGTGHGLAPAAAVEDGGGWGGVTLALNFGSPTEVDAVVEEARAAGARIGREPAETFWGGYSGVFIDPDGHAWEVAHNPHWSVTEDGGIRLG